MITLTLTMHTLLLPLLLLLYNFILGAGPLQDNHYPSAGLHTVSRTYHT
jgi:hypothetical protein